MLSKIYWIEGFTACRLGTMARPRGGEWLEDEIKGWKKAGIDVVASALTDEEMVELDIVNEPILCKANGIEFYRFPIQDRSVPPSMSEWKTFTDSLIACGNGKSLAAHCRMGVGRASIIAVSIMLRHGIDFEEAFRLTTQARGSTVPDTEEQKLWVLEFSKSLAP